MSDVKKEIGIVGLGKIGGNLAQHALEEDVRVVGFEPQEVAENLLQAGLVESHDLADLCEKLSPPRAILLYVPAGPAVDDLLDDLSSHLEQGDVLTDGGNSYWGDSVRRYERLKERGIHFVDLGTSGGIEGARQSACFMAGGERAAVARIEPILRELAAPGGYVHAGPPGAGHFTKLVHNGIEFGMLQAIGSAFHGSTPERALPHYSGAQNMGDGYSPLLAIFATSSAATGKAP